MATAERVTLIHLTLSAREAIYLKEITQNCMLYDGGNGPDNMLEPDAERLMRESIFDQLATCL